LQITLSEGGEKRWRRGAARRCAQEDLTAGRQETHPDINQIGRSDKLHGLVEERRGRHDRGKATHPIALASAACRPWPMPRLMTSIMSGRLRTIDRQARRPETRHSWSGRASTETVEAGRSSPAETNQCP
jgi:hypothetical protein